MAWNSKTELACGKIEKTLVFHNYHAILYNNSGVVSLIYFCIVVGENQYQTTTWQFIKMVIYYIDTDEIPRFFLLIKNYIFIVPSEDTIFIFHV